MSTDYTLTLTATDDTVAVITIVDRFNLPGINDSWSGEQVQWDTSGGAVSSWASGGTYLTGPYGANSIFLDGFGKSTEVDDAGTGTKNYVEGTFPDGTFKWLCTAKS